MLAEVRFGGRARSKFTHSSHAHRDALAIRDGAHAVKFGAPSEQENLSFSFALVARFIAIEPAKMLSCSDESSYG